MRIKSIVASSSPKSDTEKKIEPYFEGWLRERFGDHFAQLSTVITLKLRNAVKDVARATIGFVPPDVEELTKRFEVTPQGESDINFILGYSDEGGHHQGSIDRDTALQQYIKKYPKHWEIVKQALSLPKSRGRHASAYLISDVPVGEFIPTTTVGGVKVTAFSGPEVESVGGLKMDWLTVNQLNDISKAIDLVQSRHMGGPQKDHLLKGLKVPGHQIVLDPVTQSPCDIWDLPEDLSVFAEISKGNTESVFQFCTATAKKWLKFFNYNRQDGTPAINSILSMSVFTALDRPGPLNYEVSDPENPESKHNMLVEYSRRLRGLPKSNDVVPILDELCKDTNGIMVFQESVKKVYQELTGCSGVEAENFRYKVGKKKKEEIDKLYGPFMERASLKVSPEDAQRVWDSIQKWSQYGFCMAHAVEYCVISYASAWLKFHYPLEWWTAVLSNATKDDISEKFWSQCGDLILLPDIVHSKNEWSIEGDKIRAPLSLMHGIGEGAHNQLVKYTPYTSASNFCEAIVNHKISTSADGVKLGKSAINIGTIYTLLVSGALDSIFDPNKSIGENLDEFQALVKKHTVDKGKKYTKIKTKYQTLDALGRYQIRKDVLPIYGEDIRSKIQPGSNIFKSGDELVYKYVDWDFNAKQERLYESSIVGKDLLEAYDQAEFLPDGGIKCAIVGYIEDCSMFTWKAGEPEAKKFRIDACGSRKEMVYWPGKKGNVPQAVMDVKSGSIVVCAVSKFNPTKGFAIKKIEVIREPQETKEAEGKKNEAT